MSRRKRLNLVGASLDFFGDAPAVAPVVVEKKAVKPVLTQTAASLRKRLRIKVDNCDDVAPWPSWDGLDSELAAHPDVHRGIRAALEHSKWYEPTAVQMQAVPCLLARRDTLV